MSYNTVDIVRIVRSCNVISHNYACNDIKYSIHLIEDQHERPPNGRHLAHRQWIYMSQKPISISADTYLFKQIIFKNLKNEILHEKHGHFYFTLKEAVYQSRNKHKTLGLSKLMVVAPWWNHKNYVSQFHIVYMNFVRNIFQNFFGEHCFSEYNRLHQHVLTFNRG